MAEGKKRNPYVFLTGFLGVMAFFLGALSIAQLIQSNADVFTNIVSYIISVAVTVAGVVGLLYAFSD